MLMVTSLVRKVTYGNVLSPINSHGPSIRWSYEVTDQTKYIISSLAKTQDLD